MANTPQLLSSAYIMEVVSRLKLRNTVLQDLFGMGFTANASSRNVRPMGGRYFGWDIFDDVRDVENARMPGTAPGRITRRPVGHVSGVYPRVHSSIPLLYEEIHNYRPIGQPPGVIDKRGESYIVRQEETLAQRLVNHREFQIAAMLRGSYTYTMTGDDLIPAFSGGSVTIDFQHPASNRGTLDMLGAGAIIGSNYWSTTSNDIPGQLYAIDDAMQNQTGMRLQHVIVTSTGWNYVQNNEKVKGLAGSANRVWRTLNQQDGMASMDFTAVLEGIPWIQWHVCNEALNVNGTLTKLIPDTAAVFLPEISGDWVEYWEGSEVVVVPPAEMRGEQTGVYFYSYPTAHPAGYEMVSLMNGIPALKIPKAFAFGTIHSS